MFKEKLVKYYDNITPEQLDKLNEYYILLSEHSKLYNLTAITEEDEVVIKHYYDSLMFYEALELQGKKNLKILDMGSGAGFPGLVAAIMNEACSFTLVDSVNKKINFIKIVAEQLQLENITAIHARSEALGQDLDYRECFDIGVARSVAYLPVLCEYILPFIKVGGKMIITKEYPYEEELLTSKKALKVLGGKLIKDQIYDLPVYGNKRVFLTFNKEKKTPAEYPRREGIPSRKSI
ncbi:MAG: 16S rRNA (guanine(527)-N(7))-methyltransferase RsmG [Firmicutes bacterium]|nr:16S rRNA (guanine(527)-N(7))-methyltransferase RsmG [Bacillota bacterium]